jgi:hypothetical protein
MRQAFALVCLLACWVLVTPALAQFGHPLKGSWSGDWGPSKTDRHRILLEFDWDGKQITGTLNPGPNASPLKNIKLDPPTGGVANAAAPWMLHFEAEIKDSDGKVIPVIVDGAMENIGAYRRFITGTWNQGGKKGYFQITLN